MLTVHSCVEEVKGMSFLLCLCQPLERVDHEVDAFGVKLFGRPNHLGALFVTLEELKEKLIIPCLLPIAFLLFFSWVIITISFFLILAFLIPSFICLYLA